MVRFQLDAGAKRRLKQIWVSRGDAVPLEGVEIGRKQVRIIEAVTAKTRPLFPTKRFGVQFSLPQDLQRLSLRVIFDAGHPYHGAVGLALWSSDFFNQIESLANADDFPWRRDGSV